MSPHPSTAVQRANRAALLLAAALFTCLSTTGTGCHDSNPGNTPDGGMGNPDGFPGLMDCPGVSLTTNGTLDVNLRSLHVTGAVTQNGAALPAAASSRGSISFIDKRTQTKASFDLGSAGPGRYDLVLAPGVYDIRFAANAGLCASPTNPLPCIGGLLKSAVKLSTSGVLDLDLPTLVVQGRVTVNGAALAAAYQQSGVLTFKLQNGDTLSTASAGTGLAPYRLVLLKGSYEVDLQAPASCSAGNPLPCISGPLKTGLNLIADGTLDLDIPTFQVSGRVTVNSQPVASADVGAGALVFQLSGGGTAATDATNVGSGLSPYQLTLLPGQYDVAYLPRNNDCTTGVPCIGGALKKGLSLQSNGTLDFNLPLITTQGNVTLNGQPVNSATEPGSLVFTNADGYSVLTATTGPRQLGSYKLKLLPSTYQINYTPQNLNCSNSMAKGPCIGGPLKQGLLLMSSGVLDLDIPTITVGGAITVNRSAPSGSARGRGRLVFQLSGGDSTATVDLNPYSLRLLPGSYAVSYAYLGMGSVCQMNEAIPCASGVLKPSQSLTTSGTLDVDIPMLQANGAVTLDGMPLPAIMATRGQLQFILGGAAFFTPNFGTSGAVNYRVPLLPGSYKIAHQPDSFQCSPSTGNFPCIGQIVAGCM